MLDNRLKMCAELVSGRGTAVDVGTDHAYLAADLILSGKCSKVIASDIKEGPLESARKTVEKYNISDKAELVLSDGLENINLDGVTDIIIAGMGGETIIEILKPKVYELYGVNLILQPMTKPEILRKWLYESNIQIKTEKAADVNDRLYTVICAESDIEAYSKLTESESVSGFFDDDDELGKKYRQIESKRLEKVSEALEKSGKINEAVHYRCLGKRVSEGAQSVDMNELYVFLDEKYPFSAQEKWDNSGFLVNSCFDSVRKVLLALDITNEVIEEADNKRADVIISHHPVIFEPLKKITADDPVYKLISCDISAICMHTNLDIAQNGTNGVILKMLSGSFAFSKKPEPFEELGEGRNLGWIIELDEKVFSDEFAVALKQIFGCEYVRTSRNTRKMISRIAFCSGSGGSMLGLAKRKNCDALITGDVKHDVWVASNAIDIAVFDCGHFHTENPVLWELRRVLEEKFPQLDVEISERSVDPVIYF